MRSCLQVLNEIKTVPHLMLTKYLLFRTEPTPVLDGKDVKYIVLAIKELSIEKILIIIVTD